MFGLPEEIGAGFNATLIDLCSRDLFFYLCLYRKTISELQLLKQMNWLLSFLRNSHTSQKDCCTVSLLIETFNHVAFPNTCNQ